MSRDQRGSAAKVVPCLIEGALLGTLNEESRLIALHYGVVIQDVGMAFLSCANFSLSLCHHTQQKM